MIPGAIRVNTPLDRNDQNKTVKCSMFYTRFLKRKQNICIACQKIFLYSKIKTEHLAVQFWSSLSRGAKCFMSPCWSTIRICHYCDSKTSRMHNNSYTYNLRTQPFLFNCMDIDQPNPGFFLNQELWHDWGLCWALSMCHLWISWYNFFLCSYTSATKFSKLKI